MDAKQEGVIYLVQKRFREMGSQGHHVRVLRAEPKRDPVHNREWWMIRVEIDTPLNHLFRYYELLSSIEEKLESEDDLNTLIVPTIPEEQAA